MTWAVICWPITHLFTPALIHLVTSLPAREQKSGTLVLRTCLEIGDTGLAITGCVYSTLNTENVLIGMIHKHY
jgi:hypothetical protein